MANVAAHLLAGRKGLRFRTGGLHDCDRLVVGCCVCLGVGLGRLRSFGIVCGRSSGVRLLHPFVQGYFVAFFN